MIVGLTAVIRTGTGTSLVFLDGARFCFWVYGRERTEPVGQVLERFDEMASCAGLQVFVEVDEDVFKKGQVHESFEVFGQTPVRLVAVLEHVENACEVGFRGALVGGEGLLFPVDVSEGTGDAVLFGLEEVDGDRVCVVCLKELLPFPGEPVSFAAKGFAPIEGVAAGACDLFEHPRFDSFSVGGSDRDGAVDVGDFVFDDVDEDGFEVADRGAGLAADADEVGVDLAAFASGVVDEHA